MFVWKGLITLLSGNLHPTQLPALDFLQVATLALKDQSKEGGESLGHLRLSPAWNNNGLILFSSRHAAPISPLPSAPCLPSPRMTGQLSRLPHTRAALHTIVTLLVLV